jgi:hypothetical protein
MKWRACIRNATIGIIGLVVAVATSLAVAQTSTPRMPNGQNLEQRAVTAAIWGVPIVSVNAMRQAFFRDAKANYNDVVFWSKPSDWKTPASPKCSTKSRCWHRTGR